MLLPEEALDPPFTDEDLEVYFEFQDQADDPELPRTPGFPVGAGKVYAWSVCDTGSAEWAMRKLSHAEAFIAQRDAEAREFHSQIDRWLAGETKPHGRLVAFLQGQLESYARRKREEDEILTVKLPSGEVTSRRNPARPAVDAEDEFIEWARPTPMVKAKWSPVMAEIKKRVTFEAVRVPDFGGHDKLTLIRWPGADGESVWVAVPNTMADVMPVGEKATVAAEDLPNFHDEVWPICEGQRVPGLVQVPETVTYTIKPYLP